MEPLKVTDADRQEDFRRWRTFLGLDPDKAPSFEDIDHVDQLVKHVQSGKRLDFAPPDYNPGWPLNPEAPEPEAGKEVVLTSVEPSVSYLSTLNNTDGTGKSAAGGPSTEGHGLASINSSAKDAASEDLPPEIRDILNAAAIGLESFASQAAALREKHEQELQTKEGRARWEKIESGEPGHPPPGFYKKMKELQARHRHDQKLDWNLFQRAIKEYRQRVADGREKPPAETGKQKGKKGRK